MISETVTSQQTKLNQLTRYNKIADQAKIIRKNITWLRLWKMLITVYNTITFWSNRKLEVYQYKGQNMIVLYNLHVRLIMLLLNR